MTDVRGRKRKPEGTPGGGQFEKEPTRVQEAVIDSVRGVADKAARYEFGSPVDENGRFLKADKVPLYTVGQVKPTELEPGDVIEQFQLAIQFEKTEPVYHRETGKLIPGQVWLHGRRLGIVSDDNDLYPDDSLVRSGGGDILRPSTRPNLDGPWSFRVDEPVSLLDVAED